MKIIRAEKLISGLGGERERWIHVSNLKHLVCNTIRVYQPSHTVLYSFFVSISGNLCDYYYELFKLWVWYPSEREESYSLSKLYLFNTWYMCGFLNLECGGTYRNLWQHSRWCAPVGRYGSLHGGFHPGLQTSKALCTSTVWSQSMDLEHARTDSFFLPLSLIFFRNVSWSGTNCVVKRASQSQIGSRSVEP